MALLPGTRLGPYDVAGPIGVGGMGEVYRPRDPRLHRDVAIKVLPDAAAHDPDRLSRFEREAQVLAALNHSPNLDHFAASPDGRFLVRRPEESIRSAALHVVVNWPALLAPPGE